MNKINFRIKAVLLLLLLVGSAEYAYSELSSNEWMKRGEGQQEYALNWTGATNSLYSEGTNSDLHVPFNSEPTFNRADNVITRDDPNNGGSGGGIGTETPVGNTIGVLLVLAATFLMLKWRKTKGMRLSKK